MGLLSNPETRSRVAELIGKRGNLISAALFAAGLVYFLLLVHPAYNGGVYFSENALLPGLVNTEFKGIGMQALLDEYRTQLKQSKTNSSEVPVQWLYDEMIKIGLEVHHQDYEFTYPLNLLNNQTVTGGNVYGILRAPRASSTESMVMAVPLRPSSSGLMATDGSIALALALAKHMKKHTYWSKDIIFLFTQHEFVGVQAWLDGYFGLTTSTYIKAGRLPARAGLLQAAISLEFDDFKFDAIDVLMEGINGLLPNLDLVNLVHKLAREQGIQSTIHSMADSFVSDVTLGMKHKLVTSFSMMAHQATGMASGNHGLFLRFRVDSLTIKSIPGGRSSLLKAGELIEGVFRSVNNLLEKFHQSFFFYILPCTYRYISIGLYVPPFALIAAAALVQALAFWHYFTNEVADRNDSLITNKDQAFTADGKFTEEALHTVRLPDTILQGIYHLIPLIVGCHLAGLMMLRAPSLFGGGDIKQLAPIDTVMLGGLAGVISSMLLVRTVLRKEEFDGLNWQLFKSLVLIYHGLVLFSLALLNISLATIIAAFTVPVYSFIRPSKYMMVTLVEMLLLLIVSPLGITILAQLGYNLVNGTVTLDTLQLSQHLNIQDSIVYALIDHLVFNNYILRIVCLVLYPIWLMMWSILWMNI